jgi:2-polyprenyl-3-methyl-5-hydroxy-6-metoxy-1,4-benzoquinol methylase
MEFAALRDHLFGVAGEWSLRRCPRCRSVWVDPRPSEDEFGAIYPATYLTHDEAGVAESRRLLPAPVTRLIRIGWFGYNASDASRTEQFVGWMMGAALPFVRELVAGDIAGLAARDHGRLLDVGCGNGGFLRTMAALGWDVHGVEPDPTAARVATEALGPVVHHGGIETAPYADRSFDVITMKHVIEHVYEPMTTLTHCVRLIRPGGKLVLLTPNARSLGGWMFGADWLGWDVPRHVFVFSPAAITTVLNAAGFERVRVATPARKAARMWRMSRVLQDARASDQVIGLRSGSASAGALLFWLVEWALTKFSARGEELWAVAEKPR